MAQAFDPVAATAAYLAQLPPALHEKAKAYTQGGHWLVLWGAVVAVVVAWIVLRSGVLVRVRDGVERTKPRPWLAVLAVVVVDAIFEGVLSLPWEAYASWWREKGYGLTSQAFGGWFTEHLMGAAIGVVMTAILASGLYFLIRRAPRSWWFWGGILVGVAFVALDVVQPVVIEPLFNTYTPAPPGPSRTCPRHWRCSGSIAWSHCRCRSCRRGRRPAWPWRPPRRAPARAARAYRC